MHQQEKEGVHCPDATGNHDQGVLFAAYVLDEEQQLLLLLQGEQEALFHSGEFDIIAGCPRRW